MTWTQEDAGVISIQSAGQWLGNVLYRRGLLSATGSQSAGASLIAAQVAVLGYQSVGQVFTTAVGSDRIWISALINE